MKKLAGSKALQKKVLASVLALGVMGVANVAGAERITYVEGNAIGTVKLENKQYSDGNLTYLYANGPYFYVYFVNDTSNLTIKDSVFSNNTAKTTEDGYMSLLGGGIMLKGNVTFTDTEFKNNVLEAKSVKTHVAGGAVYGDAAINTGIYNTGAPNFIVTKDMTYSGNNVIAAARAENCWYNTWGALGQSAGGFLFLDRDSVAGFDIADGATLTIGEVGASGNMDSIASVIVYQSEKSNPIINKNGAGTLQINSDLNKYYGKINVNAGTLNVAQDWTVRNEITVKDSASLNMKSVKLVQLLDGLDFTKVYGTESYNFYDANYLKRPDETTGFTETIKAGDGGQNATTVGSIIANNANITAEAIANEQGKIEFTNSNFTGKITTGTGTSNLTFGDGNTWNLTGTSSVTDLTLNSGAVLNIGDGSAYTNGNYAVTAGTATVAEGAKLVVTGVQEATYNIIQANELTNSMAIADVEADNALVDLAWGTDANKMDLIATAKTADELAESGIVTASAAAMLGEIVSDMATGSVAAESEAAASFVEETTSGMTQGNTTAAVAATLNSALQIAESGGATGNAITVVNNVAGIATQRLSFTQSAPSVRGGHGPEEAEDKDGSGIWAQYVHGKDKVDDMPLDGMKNSYRSQYNGVIMGYDFKKSGKFQSGIAFNYGEGDSYSVNSSIGTNSDFKFYGIGYYASVKNADSNIMFDLNYSKSDSDVTQRSVQTLTANPVAKTFSAGVKLEKLIENKGVQVVPYAGLRYMHVASDDYSAYSSKGKVFGYSVDDQNIWLIPVGVSIRQENVYESGWKVTPKFDLSYIWALGDTDSSMTVSIPGVAAVSNLGYTVMDNGSFLGTIGIEAAKDDWTFGLNYSYQKGEYARSDKFFAEVRYSF